MRAFMVQIAIELGLQFLRQVVDSGAIKELLGRIECSINESENKVDDVLVLPMMRAIRIVMSERREEIAEVITEAVKTRV